jgi:hypothetical protein
MSRASETAGSEAARGERNAWVVIPLTIILWVLFLVSLPLFCTFFWWRPLYYEGFTTERAMRLAFNFFVALAVFLAFLLSLTVAAAAVAIRSELKKLMPATRASEGS